MHCELFTPFQGVPISDIDLRNNIAKKIGLLNAYKNDVLRVDDNRQTITSYRCTGAVAVVIHKRYHNNGQFLYECTLFGKQSLSPTLEKCILEYHIVQKLLLQNKSRVIINELIEDLSTLSENQTDLYGSPGHIHQHLANAQMFSNPLVSNTDFLFNNNIYTHGYPINALMRSPMLLPQIQINPYPHIFDRSNTDNDAKDI